MECVPYIEILLFLLKKEDKKINNDKDNLFYCILLTMIKLMRYETQLAKL